MKNFIQQLKVYLCFSILICITTTLSQSKIYWTEQLTFPKIQRANLDGSFMVELLNADDGLIRPYGIALDPAGGKMYWTDLNAAKLQRADLFGNGIEELLTGIEAPIEIALDINNGKMYWASSFSIHRADLDGSNEETLLSTGFLNPWGIALDLIDGKMYWTIAGGLNQIRRADLDGSNVETLLSDNDGIANPRGIDLDIPGGKMYWTQRSGDPFIMRANLDGSSMDTLVSIAQNPGLDIPTGIALDLAGGKMYWTDLGAAKIQRANLDGSNLEDVITSGILEPTYISILPDPNAIDDDVKTIAFDYVLQQNYPNPFNPTTTINYQIPELSFITLKIYDVLGSEVATLVNEEKPIGSYEVEFSTTGGATELPSGIYFYRLQVYPANGGAGNFVETKKMVLMK